MIVGRGGRAWCVHVAGGHGPSREAVGRSPPSRVRATALDDHAVIVGRGGRAWCVLVAGGHGPSRGAVGRSLAAMGG